MGDTAVRNRHDPVIPKLLCFETAQDVVVRGVRCTNYPCDGVVVMPVAGNYSQCDRCGEPYVWRHLGESKQEETKEQCYFGSWYGEGRGG